MAREGRTPGGLLKSTRCVAVACALLASVTVSVNAHTPNATPPGGETSTRSEGDAPRGTSMAALAAAAAVSQSAVVALPASTSSRSALSCGEDVTPQAAATSTPSVS